MTYIDGFVAAVPEENRQAYVDHVREALTLFKDHGATRMVENWGDDVPVGKLTDVHRSVQKRDGEAVGSNGRPKTYAMPARKLWRRISE